LLKEFRSLLTLYQGTLSNYVGDAFFAVWETGSVPHASQLALDFVVAAASRLDQLAPTLALRSPEGGPLRIGWGVARGEAAVSSMTGALLGVVGDAANLAFRLSGLAAREGRGEVLVAAAVYDDLAGRYPFDARAWVAVKGRRGDEPVHALRLPIGRPLGAS
jgi:class 3 adenylate cyclase